MIEREFQIAVRPASSESQILKIDMGALVNSGGLSGNDATRCSPRKEGGAT
jgi:hypothetical protein